MLQRGWCINVHSTTRVETLRSHLARQNVLTSHSSAACHSLGRDTSNWGTGVGYSRSAGPGAVSHAPATCENRSRPSWAEKRTNVIREYVEIPRTFVRITLHHAIRGLRMSNAAVYGSHVLHLCARRAYTCACTWQRCAWSLTLTTVPISESGGISGGSGITPGFVCAG